MKKTYALYREKLCKDSFYGSGSMEHIIELIKDYTIDHEMYGNKQVTFTIKKLKYEDSE